MKKVFLAILAFLYISASIGVTLRTHYCMGMLAEGGLSRYKSETCDRCGREKINKEDNSCCRNEYKIIKNNLDQNIPGSTLQLTHLIAIALPPSFVELSFNKWTSNTEVNTINHAPPPGSSIAVYIQNCVFLI